MIMDKVVTFRIDTETFDKFCKLAEKHDLTPADALRDLVEGAVEESPDPGEGEGMQEYLERRLNNILRCIDDTPATKAFVLGYRTVMGDKSCAAVDRKYSMYFMRGMSEARLDVDLFKAGRAAECECKCHGGGDEHGLTPADALRDLVEGAVEEGCAQEDTSDRTTYLERRLSDRVKYAGDTPGTRAFIDGYRSEVYRELAPGGATRDNVDPKYRLHFDKGIACARSDAADYEEKNRVDSAIDEGPLVSW